MLFLIVAVGAGAALWYRSTRPAQTAGPAAVALRTATVFAGPVERTLRLSGTTAAENFASLISPRLRGSRSGFGRDGGGSSGSTPATVTIQSKQGGNTNTAGGSSSNMSSSLRAATSRLSGGARSSSSSSGSSASSSGSASAMGSGLGSTGSSLFSGGGGGGGGGSDFSLVLQNLAPPGSIVKKGQPVAEFDRQYMLQRLEDYRASVNQAESAVVQRKADLAVARKIKEQDIAAAKAALDKARLDMKTTPVLSEIDTERAKLALSESEAKYKRLLNDLKDLEISQKAQIRATELELEQSRIELRRAEANAERMVLKAPIEGLTVMQTIPRGGQLDQVQKGDQLYPGMMFMSIVDTRSMVVDATVNQVDVEKLRIGQRAMVSFDAYPDLKLPARVHSVGGVPKQSGQRASYVKEIAVRLKLDQVDPRVIPDLSVSADVLLETEQASAAVPLAAIFRDNGVTPYVFVRSAAGWARREVELGIVSNLVAAVRSGLKPGEVVALEPPPKAAGSTQVARSSAQ